MLNVDDHMMLGGLCEAYFIYFFPEMFIINWARSQDFGIGIMYKIEAIKNIESQKYSKS